MAWIVETERLRNLFDANPGVFLSVASPTLTVFSTTELLHEDLVSFGLIQDLGSYTGAADFGSPQFKVTLATNRQNPVESDLVAWIGVSKIDVQRLTFFYSVLAAAVGNDRVHI